MRRGLVCLAFLVGCNGSSSKDDETTPHGDTEAPETDTDTGEPETDGPLVITDLAWEHVDAPYEGPITVMWTQTTDAPVYVEYLVDEQWQRTPDIDGLKGDNAATVVGIPLGSSAAWRIVAVDEKLQVDGDDVLETLPVPKELLAGTLEVNEPKLWADSGAYMMVPVGGLLAIMDRQAQPVWVARAQEILYAETSATGEGLMWGDTRRSRSYHAYLDASISQTVTTDHYHAMYGFPDGTVAWTDWSSRLYEVTPDDSEPKLILRDNHLHYINGISYAEDKGMYILSSYASQAVLAVDRDSGDILWSAPKRRTDVGYDFDPDDHRLKNPHGVQVLPNGNLLVSTESRGGTVWIREYEIDDKAQMLRSVWNHDSGHNDVSWSWVHRDASGSTVHTLGPSGIVYEVTEAGEVAWRVQYPEWTGRSEVIADLYALVAPPSHNTEAH